MGLAQARPNNISNNNIISNINSNNNIISNIIIINIIILYYYNIISTDEDPSLRIESSAIINLRGVSTKLNKYIVFTMQTYKKLTTLNVYPHAEISPLHRD